LIKRGCGGGGLTKDSSWSSGLLVGPGPTVWFQKISIPLAQSVIGNSEEEGVLNQRPKFLKESVSVNWISRGVGVQRRKNLCGGGMDIFWNNTLEYTLNLPKIALKLPKIALSRPKSLEIAIMLWRILLKPLKIA